nr:MAG TPA: hypothetical protein [Caudoviricetes sp.]
MLVCELLKALNGWFFLHSWYFLRLCVVADLRRV